MEKALKRELHSADRGYMMKEATVYNKAMAIPKRNC